MCVSSRSVARRQKRVQRESISAERRLLAQHPKEAAPEPRYVAPKSSGSLSRLALHLKTPYPPAKDMS